MAEDSKNEVMDIESNESPTIKHEETNSDRKEESFDPLLEQGQSDVVCEGNYVILSFSDGRQIFAQAVSSWRGKSPPVKINKRSYPTHNLIGLPYGTVLELGRGTLIPLPQGEDIIPSPMLMTKSSDAEATKSKVEIPTTASSQTNDNRNLVDDNKSQSMDQNQVIKMKEDGMDGHTIVAKLIENSSTFDGKTDFSKAKYIARKQMKYQPRCRMTRCTPSSVCEALFLKDPRRLMNLRPDSLGQILSYSNVCAGSKVLLYEGCMGVLTGALAQRMGGYGQIYSIYSGQQPSFTDMLGKYNLTFAENYSIKWLHSGEVFAPVNLADRNSEEDFELMEREQLKWPCPLQTHTRTYLENMATNKERTDFLAKRCARFARKLTRHTVMESSQWAHDSDRKFDSLILATRHDPTFTLCKLLPLLETSCPFVVFCEFLEPLVDCFRELQKQSLAINIRLSDTWMREYQILPGRTHPNMNMSQNGGFILTGIKLCPTTGKNELDDSLLKEIRAQIGGRRGKSKKNKNEANGRNGKNDNSSSNKKRASSRQSQDENNAKKSK